MLSKDHFTIDPDWEAFASENDYPYAINPGAPSPEPIQPLEIDPTEARAGQTEEDIEWASSHSLESVGYESQLISLKVRDGSDISIKVSYPSANRLGEKRTIALPVIFVTHGGGWVQGSHLSEEAWLLWPLYEHFDLVVVSVEYRMAPEHPFPTWINDSWDVLKSLLRREKPWSPDLCVKLDLHRVILAGSSSGAGISAVLSQICRDEGISLFGVILNVPVLCDYRHFPDEYKEEGRISSYRQCVDTYSSGAMIWVWNLIHPYQVSGSDPQASPLLGNCGSLPPHVIFVAGQDALRDEGIAYASKLKKSGVPVDLEIYDGVPHNFAQFSELKATARFQEDLRTCLRRWLRCM